MIADAIAAVRTPGRVSVVGSAQLVVALAALDVRSEVYRGRQRRTAVSVEEQDPCQEHLSTVAQAGSRRLVVGVDRERIADVAQWLLANGWRVCPRLSFAACSAAGDSWRNRLLVFNRPREPTG